MAGSMATTGNAAMRKKMPFYVPVFMIHNTRLRQVRWRSTVPVVMTSVYQQIRSNLIAIISLLVALSTLGYTTWRHQVSEVNRTTREAAFEILRTAEALQSVVDFAHYEMDKQTGHPIKGWEKVLYLRDMTALMPPSVHVRTEQLQVVWARDWDALETDKAAAQRVTTAIENLRAEVRSRLQALR